ncbi:recombinase family protein [Hoeflea poritis]|uniref:Recombinase family protein n=1 Tax=Hoeflea poritis TaxID=2993659 RepID=A0ABT4VX67_9HYPH|nr:recombinase family protein [Hoeflea poritis]MDA4848603.1 recombinase family protein [Hoeflea poritis]
MLKAAIYARFSTDLQNDRSIDDQIELCRTFAAKENLTPVAVFEDRAQSGSTIIGRNGIAKLMRAAQDGQYCVLVVEALDRLSRDQEDLAHLWKRLSFLGIEIRAVHEGTADAVQVGIRGLLGTLYLADLANKVRRGMQGVVRDGRHAGGKAYGYRPVPGRPGALEIVDEEAAIVQRIFNEYLAGKTPREIASGLNNDGIDPPRGKQWVASTINGNRSRHYGILINELYAGRLIWNRVRMVKDPDTGRRVSRPNPPEEWNRENVPQLAIIDNKIFDAVQARKTARSCEYPAKQRKAKRLLSGLLKCQKCGGGISIKDRDNGRIRIHCSTRKESGSCDNKKIYYLDQIETAVLSGLQEHLESPELLAEFVETYQKERIRLAADKQKAHLKLENDLARTQRSIDRIWAEYEDELIDMKLAGPKLRSLNDDKEAIELRLAAMEPEPNVISLHPTAVKRYRQYVTNLSKAFDDGISPDNEEAASAIRDLVQKIAVGHDSSGQLTLSVHGRLAALTDAPKLYPNMMISASGCPA